MFCDQNFEPKAKWAFKLPFSFNPIPLPFPIMHNGDSGPTWITFHTCNFLHYFCLYFPSICCELLGIFSLLILEIDNHIFVLYQKILLYKNSLKRKRSKCFNFSCFIAQETLRDILTACWKNCDISAFLLASSSKIIDLKSKGMATKYSKMSYFLLFLKQEQTLFKDLRRWWKTKFGGGVGITYL